MMLRCSQQSVVHRSVRDPFSHIFSLTGLATTSAGSGGAEVAAAHSEQQQMRQEGADKLQAVAIAPQQLRGIYPNAHGEGVGEAHLFALREWTQANEGRMAGPRSSI